MICPAVTKVPRLKGEVDDAILTIILFSRSAASSLCYSTSKNFPVCLPSGSAPGESRRCAMSCHKRRSAPHHRMEEGRGSC
jgi:hypothetical protein